MNRLLPDFSKHRGINSLSFLGEVFFRRLWNKADDFGRYYADPKILNAELFPLKDIRLPDICRALEECERAALLVQYKIKGESYLQIHDFNQRVRRKKSAFPPPSDDLATNDLQIIGTCRTFDGHLTDKSPPEDENEDEDEEKNKKKISDAAERIWELYPKKDDKQGAIGAIIRRLNEGLSEEYLIERVKAYSICASGKDNTYIKNARGWFNEERYLDESLDDPIPAGMEIDLDTFRKAYFCLNKHEFDLDVNPDLARIKEVLNADMKTLISQFRPEYDDVVKRLSAPFSKLKQEIQYK